MKSFTRYDPESGKVLSVGAVPESMIELQGANVFVGEIDADTQYVKDGQACQRPVNPASRTENLLHQLPAPCQIIINGKSYPCADPTAELTFTYPGTYQVRVEAFPFLDASFEVVKE
jgi:hypothetical protein